MDDAAQLATGVAAAVTAASAWYLFGGAEEPKRGKRKKQKRKQKKKRPEAATAAKSSAPRLRSPRRGRPGSDDSEGGAAPSAAGGRRRRNVTPPRARTPPGRLSPPTTPGTSRLALQTEEGRGAQPSPRSLSPGERSPAMDDIERQERSFASLADGSSPRHERQERSFASLAGGSSPRRERPPLPTRERVSEPTPRSPTLSPELDKPRSAPRVPAPEPTLNPGTPMPGAPSQALSSIQEQILKLSADPAVKRVADARAEEMQASDSDASDKEERQFEVSTPGAKPKQPLVKTKAEQIFRRFDHDRDEYLDQNEYLAFVKQVIGGSVDPNIFEEACQDVGANVMEGLSLKHFASLYDDPRTDLDEDYTRVFAVDAKAAQEEKEQEQEEEEQEQEQDQEQKQKQQQQEEEASSSSSDDDDDPPPPPPPPPTTTTTAAAVTASSSSSSDDDDGDDDDDPPLVHVQAARESDEEHAAPQEEKEQEDQQDEQEEEEDQQEQEEKQEEQEQEGEGEEETARVSDEEQAAAAANAALTVHSHPEPEPEPEPQPQPEPDDGGGTTTQTESDTVAYAVAEALAAAEKRQTEREAAFREELCQAKEEAAVEAMRAAKEAMEAAMAEAAKDAQRQVEAAEKRVAEREASFRAELDRLKETAREEAVKEAMLAIKTTNAEDNHLQMLADHMARQPQPGTTTKYDSPTVTVDERADEQQQDSEPEPDVEPQQEPHANDVRARSPKLSPRERTVPQLITADPSNSEQTALQPADDSIDALGNSAAEIETRRQQRANEAQMRETAQQRLSSQIEAKLAASSLSDSQDLFSKMDFNNDGVITREEFEVAALELQLRNQQPVGGGRYDATAGSDSWLSRSPEDGCRSVGTDRTASDFSGTGGSPSPIQQHDTSPSRTGAIIYKRDVKTLEGVYTGPMLLDPTGALVKHGENGTMHYSNGEYYQGSWVQDRPEGPLGVYHNPEGQNYTGPWRQGLFHGLDGKCVWSDGSCYEGPWQKGYRHTYASSSTRGVMTWTVGEYKGCRWEGPWFMDEMHGTGLWRNAEGEETQREYDRGDLVREKPTGHNIHSDE